MDAVKTMMKKQKAEQNEQDECLRLCEELGKLTKEWSGKAAHLRKFVELFQHQAQLFKEAKTFGVPICNCGEVTKVNQVKKDGPNLNKWFYSCPKKQDDITNCKLFQWVPDKAQGDFEQQPAVQSSPKQEENTQPAE